MTIYSKRLVCKSVAGRRTIWLQVRSTDLWVMNDIIISIVYIKSLFIRCKILFFQVLPSTSRIPLIWYNSCHLSSFLDNFQPSLATPFNVKFSHICPSIFYSPRSLPMRCLRDPRLFRIADKSVSCIALFGLIFTLTFRFWSVYPTLETLFLWGNVPILFRAIYWKWGESSIFDVIEIFMTSFIHLSLWFFAFIKIVFAEYFRSPSYLSNSKIYRHPRV